MRVFIGIKLEGDTIQTMLEATRPYKRLATPIRWVKPENLHLTIKFIGEVSEEKTSQITEALEAIDFETEPFEVGIHGFGTFGRGGIVNIFWAGIEKDTGLEDIFTRIEDRLEKINIPRETREFNPHLTLGRNKKNHNFKSLVRKIEETGQQPITRFQVHGVQLFKSDLSAGGPTYAILKEIHFADA